MRTKRAVIYAETVVVLCPHCSEPAYAPNGSEYWTIQELVGTGCREHICNACEEKYSAALFGTVQVDRKVYPTDPSLPKGGAE